MELVERELLFMVRNSKHATLPATCTSSRTMMYRVMFVFFEINPSSKCLQPEKPCYKGWKLEYRGNLMVGYFDHPAGTMYTCDDEYPDTLHGGRANQDEYSDGVGGARAFVYGAEFETCNSPGNLHKLADHDVPCDVCLLRNQSVVKMFTEKPCYKGWKLEYRGNLMVGYYDHPAGTMYTCDDEYPDTLHGGRANQDGRLFYSVEARCGFLKCPPYVERRELMIVALILVIFVMEVRAVTNDGSCKDMLQQYLTGHLSVVYTRWGKKTCPSNAELVLSGFTGGSWYDHKGAAVDLLCLPRDPEWGEYIDGVKGTKAYVFGAEYETYYTISNLRKVYNHDVPCAVCLLRNKSVVKMFPARKTCYKGWKLEYHGNLMAGYYNSPAGTMYTCVDEHPDTLHGGRANQDGRLFYSVEARCGSLKCPPYVEGRELVCAVCSKE
ncbi:uncharacterized protein LOC128169166 [Crassostrea angulata]|uniref:uncharacterized protein LOC128169166 n=1 Tax=Magallana angulata TaxID=2784310 RepID=UPI0022B122C0|nr:uncharacterized protein LOC128169166 [Crassostrea angulata]